jgi:transposase
MIAPCLKSPATGSRQSSGRWQMAAIKVRSLRQRFWNGRTYRSKLSNGSDTAVGFKVVPKRWIVERTFGWLGRCRRLAKDFENTLRSLAAFFMLAMIRLMLRRIVRAEIA